MCVAVGIATELAGVPESLRFYGFVAFGVVYLVVMRRTWQRKRFLGRPISDLTAS